MEIEESTRSQANSPDWHTLRHDRITASTFGRIPQWKRKFETLASEMLDSKEGKKRIPKVLQQKFAYGKLNEPIALEMYHTYMERSGCPVSLEACGLIIPPDAPWLAATPDSKVIDSGSSIPYGIVEVKCPEGKKSWDPEVASTDPKFCLQSVDGHLRLKRDHEYFAQVQGQLVSSGAKWCDFVLYTSKGLMIERISYDPTYWIDMSKSLNKFFFEYYLAALGSRT